MNHKISLFNLSVRPGACLGLLFSLSGAAFASAITPVILAQADTSMSAPAPTATAPNKSAMSAMSHVKLSATDKAEIRIKDLHAKLKITSDQEALWGAVAQVMRDNAATMEDLAGKREASASGMTAVDDLKSYEEIAAAHVEGLKNFIPAFEALYNAMSDAQKKTADALFEHQRHGAKMKKAPISK